MTNRNHAILQILLFYIINKLLLAIILLFQIQIESYAIQERTQKLLV